jgi:RNA polymerase sigma-32 factor
MSSIVVPTLSADRGLSAYLREVRSFPILSVEDEIKLARRWRDEGDVDAAHKLVTSHLKLVVKIARQFQKYTLPFEDLISEGTIGLMKAVRKFDPEKGYRLSTYALWWIKAEITEFVLKSWSLVRIGSITVQKKLFFNLHRAKARLQNLESGDADADINEQLADELGVSIDDVQYLGTRMEKGDLSLNQPANEFGDGSGEAYLDRLVSDTPDPERLVISADHNAYLRLLIEQAMSELTDRDREIIRARRLSEDGVTLEDLGQRFGVSRERIRQIEERALAKIKASICDQLGIESPGQISMELLTA